MSPVRRPLPSALAAAALLAAALLVYWPGFGGGFILDDHPNLVRDSDWKVSGVTFAEWWNAARSGIASGAGRPLSILGFAANHALTGMDPFWFKVTNALMHGLNGLFVWLLALRLFALLPFGTAPRPGRYAAALLAAAWLVHPLQASTVLYVVQRMEICAATGTLLALLFYLRAREAMLAERRWWPQMLMAGAAVALGLGFKESALLAPCFALAIEVTLLHFRGPGGGRSAPLVRAYAALLVLGLALYAMVAVPIVLSSPAFYAGRDFTLAQRLLTQLPVLVMYLKQSLLPLPDLFAFYYDDFPVSRGLFLPRATAAAGGILLSFAALAVACRVRMPLLSLGIAWFFVAHALTSNVVPLELAFEHRNYLALFGVLLALVQPLCVLGRRLNADARMALAALPVLALAGLCAVQAATWGDPLQLAWTLENRSPQSPRASYALGNELLLAAGNDPLVPAWSMAYGQFEHAAALRGASVLPVQALVILDGQHGREIPTERWQELRTRLTARPLGPESAGALYAVSQCRIERRCSFRDEELLATFLAVLARNPGNSTVLTMYANFLWNVAGDRTLAIAVLRDAVASAPQQPAPRAALAKFLVASGDPALVAEGRALGEQDPAGHK